MAVKVINRVQVMAVTLMNREFSKVVKRQRRRHTNLGSLIEANGNQNIPGCFATMSKMACFVNCAKNL